MPGTRSSFSISVGPEGSAMDRTARRRWLPGSGAPVGQPSSPGSFSPGSRARAGFIASHRGRGLFRSKTLGRSKDLQILTAGFDPGENQTHALFHNKGNVAAELTAAGKGKDPLGVHSFKSSVKVKTFLKRCKTVRQAVDGFFAAQGAVIRELAVVEVNGLLELRDDRGRAVSAKELSEIGIQYYVPITAEENPAGVRLQAAINTGDVEAARQAIADGASLEFVPDLLRSPLAIAFDDTLPRRLARRCEGARRGRCTHRWL